jgi:fatty-acid desaturase
MMGEYRRKVDNFIKHLIKLLSLSTIYPVENMMVAALAAGEGWHNYHVSAY